MKILAFSDLHLARARAADLVAAATEADLVIGAGDFCNARKGLDQAVEMLAGIAAPVVAVPGNAESAEELVAAAPAHWHVLHGQGATVAGLRLFGLGGAVPETPFGAWSFDLSEDTAAQMLALCEAADILILHSPPKGLGDLTSQGVSLGSTSILAAIERIQPKLAVFGHIHDCWGTRGQIGASHVANVGPTVNWFEVTR